MIKNASPTLHATYSSSPLLGWYSSHCVVYVSIRPGVFCVTSSNKSKNFMGIVAAKRFCIIMFDRKIDFLLFQHYLIYDILSKNCKIYQGILVPGRSVYCATLAKSVFWCNTYL